MKIDLTVAGYIFNNKKEVLLIHHKKLNLWLPVGGHIDEDETPDDALIREVKEETSLDIRILHEQKLPVVGNVIRNLATPFHVNLHSVGDHQHVGNYYVCQALNPKQLQFNPGLK